MDVDGDGDDDLLTCYDLGPMQWIRNDGGMNFGLRSTIVGSPYAEFVDVVDMDMDGDLDIFTVQNYQGAQRASYMEHLAGASFAAPVLLITDVEYGQCWPRAMDADRDGDPDIVLPLPITGGVILFNDGTGSFGPAQPLSGTNLNVESFMPFVPHDMDGDGDLDIVYYTDRGTLFGPQKGIGWSENFLGDPYHLSGIVFADLNSNGIRDNGEPGLPGALITANPAGYIAVGNTTGSYLVYSNAGSQTVSAALPSSFWALSTTPTSFTVAPTSGQPDWTDLDFGFVPVVDTSLLVPELVMSGAPCSTTTSLWLTIHNQGTRVENGTITLTLDVGFAFVSATPTPLSVSGNVITWSFDDLGYFGTQGIHVIVQMPGVAFNGMPYQISTYVTALDDQGSVTGVFNTALGGVVACPFDPNDKQVNPVGYGPPGAISIDEERLIYTIRFQNTGTAPAMNVMLRDQLDASLDLSHLQVLGFSHVPTNIGVEPAGELVIRFDNIQLPDSGSNFIGSQGFITFSVGLIEGLPDLTEIHNTAEIYFDLNPPVITNTTLTTLVDCSLWQPVIAQLADDLLEASNGAVYQWFLNGEPLNGAQEQHLFVEQTGFYSVLVTSLYGCSIMTDEIEIVVMAIRAEGQVHRLVLAPNPVSGVARLFFDAPMSATVRIEVVDMHGRIVRTIQGNGSGQVLIDPNGMRAGLYVIRLVENGSTFATVRMVVE